MSTVGKVGNPLPNLPLSRHTGKHHNQLLRRFRPDTIETRRAFRQRHGPKESSEARTMGEATYLRSRKKPLPSARSSVTLFAWTPWSLALPYRMNR